MVGTLPSNAGGASSIPGWGAKIPNALQPRNQNIKQKQYCNEFNKDLKKKRRGLGFGGRGNASARGKGVTGQGGEESRRAADGPDTQGGRCRDPQCACVIVLGVPTA